MAQLATIRSRPICAENFDLKNNESTIITENLQLSTNASLPTNASSESVYENYSTNTSSNPNATESAIGSDTGEREDYAYDCAWYPLANEPSNEEEEIGSDSGVIATRTRALTDSSVIEASPSPSAIPATAGCSDHLTAALVLVSSLSLWQVLSHWSHF